MSKKYDDAVAHLKDHGALSLYKATFDEEWYRGLKRYIPAHMQEGVAMYVLFGAIPGGFLQSVIEGDLFTAVARADEVNMHSLPNYVRFFYSYSPAGIAGHPDRVKVWVAKGGIYGRPEA